MATAKAKARAAFSYQGKQYQPGEEVEAPDHEIMQLVQQGHVEDPRGQSSTQQGQQGKPPQQGGQQHEQHGHEQHAGRKHESEHDGDDD